MASRLNPKIMEILTKKLGKKDSQIRPRLSEIRREHSGLTMNAAAQIYAQKHKTSVMTKLDQEDRSSLASVQAITQVSVSNVSKVDRRMLNINNSPIHNLSFGDSNTINQRVAALDNALVELLSEISDSTALTDDDRNDYKSDIQTIISQVRKSKPNRNIIKAAWGSVKALADIEGFVQLVGRIALLIQSFL